MTCGALLKRVTLWLTRPACESEPDGPGGNPRSPRISARTGTWTLLAFCGILFACMPLVMQAQETKATEDLKPRPETLTTKDDRPLALAITYWPSAMKQDGAVVVLLHGQKGNQLDWGALPKALQDEGYAVIAVDLRGHGQSKTVGATVEAVETNPKKKPKPAKLGVKEVDANNLKVVDYENMVQYDMKAVKAFIFSEHQKKKLNMNKMGIIGGTMGASVGLQFAARDWMEKPHSDGPVGNQTPRGQDVRALVLLTPDPEVKLPLTPAVDTLRAPILQVAMLFGVGKKDKPDKGTTKSLFEKAATPEIENNNPDDPSRRRMYLVEYNSPARGTGLLGKNLSVEVNLTNFLKKHLQEVKSEWRDRESKLGRKKPA